MTAVNWRWQIASAAAATRRWLAAGLGLLGSRASGRRAKSVSTGSVRPSAPVSTPGLRDKCLPAERSPAHVRGMPVSSAYYIARSALRRAGGRVRRSCTARRTFHAVISVSATTRAAASRVGLDTLTDDEWRTHFARFEPLPDNQPEPLALRYHGHQFPRSYNPNLGDGRGFVFAQVREAGTGRLLDLATKGSGRENTLVAHRRRETER